MADKKITEVGTVNNLSSSDSVFVNSNGEIKQIPIATMNFPNGIKIGEATLRYDSEEEAIVFSFI